MRALLMSPRALLSPRRGRAERPPLPPPSPAFLGLLASPLPAARRARAAARAAAPPPPRAPSRWLRLLRRLMLSCAPFLLGVLLSALLFAPAAPQTDEDALFAALAATRDAAALWRVALAPGALALTRSAWELAVYGAHAAARVPLQTWALAAAALALCVAALAAWRALSRALSAAAAALSRRYAALHAAVHRRSVSAAALLPHAATLGCGALLLRLAPPVAARCLLSSPALGAATLALPALASLAALRSPLSSQPAAPPAARPARRWLAFWCALAPALLLADAPLLPALLQRLPGARAAWALCLLWLLAPPTRGADVLAAALTPYLAPLGNRAASVRSGPRAAAAATWMRAAASVLRLPPGVTGAAEAALRSATPLLLCCLVGLVTPGALTRYAAAVAGVLCPAASSLAAMAAMPPAPAYERGWLTYWAVYGAAAALAAALPALGRVPLAQHARLAAVLWLQLLGGAPRVAAAAATALAQAIAQLRQAGTRLVPPPLVPIQAGEAEAEVFVLRRAEDADSDPAAAQPPAAAAARLTGAVSPDAGASGGPRRRSGRRQKSLDGEADETTPQRS